MVGSSALLIFLFDSNVKLLVGELNFDIYVRHHRLRKERQRSREQDSRRSKEE